MEYKDYLIRATAFDGQVRAFAATTREMVEEARKLHNTWPTATAALGRTLTAASMMGITMKGEKDLLTIQIKGDGPLGQILVTAGSDGMVKGYVENPEADMPTKNGKLNVGGAVGSGYLTVIKDLGLKEPYVGRIDLKSGEIADDLTTYFYQSEQVPSSVALGVLMSKSNHVETAGGFIIQLMPDASDVVINALEERLSHLKPVTVLLSEGMTPEEILNCLLGDFDLKILEKLEVAYKCNCSRERISKALLTLGNKELNDLIEDNSPIEIKCQFCGKKYSFDSSDIKNLLERK